MARACQRRHASPGDTEQQSAGHDRPGPARAAHVTGTSAVRRPVQAPRPLRRWSRTAGWLTILDSSGWLTMLLFWNNWFELFNWNATRPSGISRAAAFLTCHS